MAMIWTHSNEQTQMKMHFGREIGLHAQNLFNQSTLNSQHNGELGCWGLGDVHDYSMRLQKFTLKMNKISI